jgi:hypothetical protein
MIIQCLANPVEPPVVVNKMHSSLALERKRMQDNSFFSNLNLIPLLQRFF